MNPLFSVGERVKVCSASHPQYNGEYSVVDVIKDGLYQCAITGLPVRIKGEQIGYRLNATFKAESGLEHLASEPSLRKIYPLADKSFNEILESLKQPGNH